MKYLLGIDSGGTMTKAGLYDLSGNEIAVAKRKLDIMIPGEGMNERDLEQFRNANMDVIKQVIQKIRRGRQKYCGNSHCRTGQWDIYV